MKNDAINLNERKEGYMGEFGGRKEQEDMM